MMSIEELTRMAQNCIVESISLTNDIGKVQLLYSQDFDVDLVITDKG